MNQTLGSFRALVGPNASGKTAFLDVIRLMEDLVKNRGGVLETMTGRSSSFDKLLWMGPGNSFQLAVEAAIPENIHKIIAKDKQRFTSIRYEIEVGLTSKATRLV